MLAQNNPAGGGFAKVANAADEDDPGRNPRQVAKAPDPRKVINPKASPRRCVDLDPKKVWEEALKAAGPIRG